MDEKRADLLLLHFVSDCQARSPFSRMVQPVWLSRCRWARLRSTGSFWLWLRGFRRRNVPALM
jgi:hypothetical protein